MAAKELQGSQEMDLLRLIPVGYHIYVIGLQEGMSDGLYKVVETHLKPHNYIRLPISSNVEGR
jgi:hypothetical protein